MRRAPPHAPRVRRRRCFSGLALGSERFRRTLAGTDPDHLFDGGDPDLAVTDLPGTGSGDDSIDDLLYVDLVGHHLDPDLGQELHRVLGAPVHLGVALLTAVPLYLADG